MNISGKILDLFNRKIYNGTIKYNNGKIISITQTDQEYSNYILPGLIDSHVHIESSMLTPKQFSKIVVPRGTVAVVTDPHEIANVMGVEGVEYMIQNSKGTPLKCFFGAPSCVPATSFETSGAVITSEDIELLLQKEEVYALSEMMNFPGVIYEDEEVLKKIKLAHKYGKKIDGHAPGLVGEDLKKYAQAGITTDHECINTNEAIDKINQGIVVQIREGSAAKNFDNLASLFDTHPDDIMLCTDDSHSDEILQKGHIDKIIKLGIAKGIDIFKLLRAATIKPVEHYNLPVGLLREGDDADFIVVDNLDDFNILETYINGEKVYTEGKITFDLDKSEAINNFNISSINEDEIKILPQEGKNIRVIEAVDGDLITDELIWKPNIIDGNIVSSIDEDILKIVVVNRYKTAPPVVGFIKNIGLKKGAIACSVAHDSHNLIAVGVSDQEIVKALNEIIACRGGITCVNNDEINTLPLEIGGLMTDEDGQKVAENYLLLNEKVKEFGSPLKAPFMTLSFMSLLVIPKIKIGDKGLFDVSTFSFTNLFV
ncbi:adenine deaminase [Plebeiibacterium sediminum]|uniref:Adenine deaminase n=1 Tax=Plebeiibacterium sediminum TaxID=2992112 RepID=A0AAE3M1P4_9BACT|nr:adenine deaminase [Plebeiobacterium sediminum]MCW3785180.1 adenine deaminase [Plebeiobacterium sediminum]